MVKHPLIIRVEHPCSEINSFTVNVSVSFRDMNYLNLSIELTKWADNGLVIDSESVGQSDVIVNGKIIFNFMLLLKFFQPNSLDEINY